MARRNRPARYPPGDFTILHTDDNPGFLQLMALFLRRYGFKVRTTPSADEVLRLCREEPISLLITDLMRPQMGGHDLIRAVRADPLSAHIPILVFTAVIDQSRHALALQYGANLTACKPLIDQRAFLEQIASLIPVDREVLFATSPHS